jgi:ribosomal protein L37AE/L43A
MQKIKLTPDDVLTGAGTYREEVEIDCPVCDKKTGFKTDDEITECDECGSEFGVDKPFS